MTLLGCALLATANRFIAEAALLAVPLANRGARALSVHFAGARQPPLRVGAAEHKPAAAGAGSTEQCRVRSNPIEQAPLAAGAAQRSARGQRANPMFRVELLVPAALSRGVVLLLGLSEAYIERTGDDAEIGVSVALAEICTRANDADCARFHATRAAVRGRPSSALAWLAENHGDERVRRDARLRSNIGRQHSPLRPRRRCRRPWSDALRCSPELRLRSKRVSQLWARARGG